MAQHKSETGYQTDLETSSPPKPVAVRCRRDRTRRSMRRLGFNTEQISGTAFTAPRALNRRTWSYRIRPSVMHERYHEFPQSTLLRSGPFSEAPTPPNQMRWNPLPISG